MKDDSNDKAAKRWAYLIHGNVCVSIMEADTGERLGLFVSTPAGNKECFSIKEINEFVDQCMNLDHFYATYH